MVTKFQYSILCQFNDGRPFYTNVYDYLDVCFIALNDFIKKDKHYKRPYYVYNSFFKNEFSEEFAKSKYKILIRDVGEWYDYTNFDFFSKI